MLNKPNSLLQDGWST